MPRWKTANVARASGAVLVAFALVILSASLAEALFGPRTTLGENYQQTSDELSRVNGDPCNNVSSCAVFFQRAPQRLPLIVQHVSCEVQVAGGVQLRSAKLRSRKGTNFPFRYTHLVPVHTTGDIWVINSPVMHLFTPRENPFVNIIADANTAWFAECNISGQLQQP